MMEWPARLLLQSSTGAAVFTPGAVARGNPDQHALDVAEILLEDSLDGLLAAHLGDVGIRVVGTGYPDPGRPGQMVDVVALMMPSRTRQAGKVVSRQYWIDASTRLPVRIVRGEEGVEVRLSNWQDIQGNRFASTATVLQNGIVKYTMAITPTGIGPKLNDGTFDPK